MGDVDQPRRKLHVLLDQVDDIGAAGDEVRGRVGRDLARGVGNVGRARIAKIVHGTLALWRGSLTLLTSSRTLSVSSRTATRVGRPAEADPGSISRHAFCGEMDPGSRSPRAIARGSLGRDDRECLCCCRLPITSSMAATMLG